LFAAQLHPNIGESSGAENDAREIFDQLIKNGGLDVSDIYYLLQSDATQSNILNAFSEVFLKYVNCNLVMHYFAGYCIFDEDKSRNG
jgi:hypothetical protein